MELAFITYSDLVYFVGILFLVFLILIVYFGYEWWQRKLPPSVSPYTRLPLRRGNEIPYQRRIQVLRYLYELHDYYNGIIDFQKAAFCRETGRLFPKCQDWQGKIKLDWTFLQKRFPGHYVSWGSLTTSQQEAIRMQHHSLDGFQTDYSSGRPSPRDIEPEYAYAKPGPLYVDMQRGVLLGWKKVPDTEIEVLIVQKPIKKYIPGLTKI